MLYQAELMKFFDFVSLKLSYKVLFIFEITTPAPHVSDATTKTQK